MKNTLIRAEQYLRDQISKDTKIDTLGDIPNNCEQQIEHDKTNCTLDEDNKRTMQTSSLDDTANRYQEVDNCGTDSHVQNIPVITKRWRQNKANNGQHQQLKGKVVELPKRNNNDIQTKSEQGTSVTC